MGDILAPLAIIFWDIQYLLAMRDSFDSDQNDTDRIISFVERRSIIY